MAASTIDSSYFTDPSNTFGPSAKFDASAWLKNWINKKSPDTDYGKYFASTLKDSGTAPEEQGFVPGPDPTAQGGPMSNPLPSSSWQQAIPDSAAYDMYLMRNVIPELYDMQSKQNLKTTWQSLAPIAVASNLATERNLAASNRRTAFLQNLPINREAVLASIQGRALAAAQGRAALDQAMAIQNQSAADFGSRTLPRAMFG